MSSWDGVGLNGASARVAALRLRDHGLGGSIPAGLGSLAGLTQLNLSWNDLSGSIPAGLGGLSTSRPST